jgi:hypothetical protein
MRFAPSLFLLLVYYTAGPATDPPSLPTIDLGYVRQRATEYNTTTGLYIYRNIRYAHPPIADLRFRKPQPPLPEPAGTISDGSQYKTTVCPQAVNRYTPSANGFSEDCLVSGIFIFVIHVNNLHGLAHSSLTSMCQAASIRVTICPCSCGSTGVDIYSAAKKTYI